MAEFKQIYSKEERSLLIRKFKNQIKRQLKDVDKETLKFYDNLITDAANYAAQIHEFNAIIQRDGVIEYYQNGNNQWGTKKSVAAELKPKYTSTYQSIIRQLSKLLPSESEKDAAQELMDFLNGG